LGRSPRACRPPPSRTMGNVNQPASAGFADAFAHGPYGRDGQMFVHSQRPPGQYVPVQTAGGRLVLPAEAMGGPPAPGIMHPPGQSMVVDYPKHTLTGNDPCRSSGSWALLCISILVISATVAFRQGILPPSWASTPAAVEAPGLGPSHFVGATYPAASAGGAYAAAGARATMEAGSAPREAATPPAPIAAEPTKPPPPPSPDMLDLVSQAGGASGRLRGNISSPERKAMVHIFHGTHVEGHPPTPSDAEFKAMLRGGQDAAGWFGPVVLSEKAAALRAALKQKGFEHMPLFHGTKSMWLPAILTTGFLESHGWHGLGVYTAETFAHAQCYSGPGQPILRLEVYFRPEDRERYVEHVHHDSMADDVWLVKDPLLIIPLEVIKCCPMELTCLRRL